MVENGKWRIGIQPICWFLEPQEVLLVNPQSPFMIREIFNVNYVSAGYSYKDFYLNLLDIKY